MSGPGMDRRDFLRLSMIGAALAAVPSLPNTVFGAQVPVSLDQVRLAAGRLRGNLRRTPCVSAGMLSKLTGTDLYLKLENLQYTGAFKERGALNKMSTLTPEERKRGVIAASAGNHSQGVAFHATRLGIRSVIAMPHGTPNSKINRTRSLGAEVVVTGKDFDEALAYALKKADEDGLTFVHPFDDPLVVCGQGTVGLEIMEDVPDVDILLVPVGGGGLISGCATAAKALDPKIKVYGVEPVRYAGMRQELHHEPVHTGGETLAEGLAVHSVGKLPLKIVSKLVEDVILVDEEHIEKAITEMYGKQKVVAEGAGAVGVAALMQHNSLFAGKRVATPVTGGNIDSRLYADLLQRGMAHDGRLVKMSVSAPGRGDVYPEIAKVLADNEVSVVDLEFDQIFHAASPKSPCYDLVLETRDMAQAEELVERFRDMGFSANLVK